jgi:hypothetical protein
LELKVICWKKADMAKQDSNCEYRKTCYFYNVKNITPDNKRFKEMYCIEWPPKCPIYQTRTKRKTLMTEAEKLHNVQHFITRELQKQGADRVGALTWEQTPQDRVTNIHRLVLFLGGEKSIFTFTEYELLDNYGSKQWEKQLQSHVNAVRTELLNG